MKITITKNYAEMSAHAALVIAEIASAKPAASLVVATGNTPVGTYAELVALKERGQFDPSQLKVFQLDEYLGLPEGDKRQLWGWMERVFTIPLAIQSANVVRLNSDTTDAKETCAAYDRAVDAAGGFDLAILGLGPNGHLAFNEPPADSCADTRVVTLTEESLVSNSVYWGGRGNVPPQAMTAGLRQLLGAKRIILLVSGASKREILKRVTTGPVSDLVPASFLQLHPCVDVICDEDAS